MTLTYEELLDLLSYDQASGELRWKVKRKSVDIGDIAGGVRKNNGRRTIQINGEQYYASRIIWLYMTKEWPKEQIDHIDGNRDNNRWANLRDVSQAINARNRPEHRQGKKVGPSYRSNLNKWAVEIRKDNKRVYLGVFNTEEEGHQAYIKWAKDNGI